MGKWVATQLMLSDLGSEMQQLCVEKSIISKKYAFWKCDNKHFMFTRPQKKP